MDGAGEGGHSLSLPYRGHGSQAYGSSRRGDGANDPRPGVVTSRQPQSRPRRRRTPESEARAGGGPSLSRRSRLHTLSRRTWSRPAYRDSESAESASSSSSSVDSKSPGPGLSSSQPRQRDGCSGPQSRLSESARAGSVAGFSFPCRQISQRTTSTCVIPWGRGLDAAFPSHFRVVMGSGFRSRNKASNLLMRHSAVPAARGSRASVHSASIKFDADALAPRAVRGLMRPQTPVRVRL